MTPPDDPVVRPSRGGAPPPADGPPAAGVRAAPERRLTARLREPGTSVAAATPIWISRRSRTVLLLASLVALVLLLDRAPTVLTLALGGMALALLLSYPVRALSRVMPKAAAIALSLLVAGAALVLLLAVVVPILLEQLGGLARSAPDILRNIGERASRLLGRLDTAGLLPTSPEVFLDNLQRDLLTAVQDRAGRLVGGLGRILSRAFAVAVTTFGIVFVAVYLLSDARRLHAAVLRTTPRRYRHDVDGLWDAFAHSLSRYIAGLTLSLAIQGVLSAAALYFIGVPYALLLGVWVALTGIIPYLGAWIGAIPAVLLALSVSPTRALMTAVLFLLIQQLEGNVLTPRIQSEAVRVHPILVFLAVIAGTEIFGLAGAVFAVPAVAVLRVLFDFFAARLRVRREAVTVTLPAAADRVP